MSGVQEVVMSFRLSISEYGMSVPAMLRGPVRACRIRVGDYTERRLQRLSRC